MLKGTLKNLHSVEALPLGFFGFIAEIGLGGVKKNNIRVFRGSLNNNLDINNQLYVSYFFRFKPLYFYKKRQPLE